MKPSKQLFRHNPAEGTWGDCYRTAVACLLDLATADVPHVYDQGVDGETGTAAMNAFLAGRGLVPVTVIYDGDADLQQVLTAREHYTPGIPYMLIGQSGNNVDHVVIACDGRIIWDPSLDDSGIIGPSSDGHWWIEYLGALL